MDPTTGQFLPSPMFRHPSMNEEITCMCGDENNVVAYGTNLGSIFMGITTGL
jgi:hypothetical protein